MGLLNNKGCIVILMLDALKDYVRNHSGEIVVYAIIAAVLTTVGIAIGMHPLDAVARTGHGR